MNFIIFITLCGFFHSSLTAPWLSSSSGDILNNAIEDTVNIEELTAEVKASLEFVKILPSPILPRKLTEAVTILSQALTNPNPILHTACENALLDVKLTTDGNQIVKKLKSFLANLLTQLTAPGSMFPEKFSSWLKNQILVVQSAIEYNQHGIDVLADKFPTESASSILKKLQLQAASFELFIQTGLEMLMSEPALEFNLVLQEMQKSIIEGKYNEISSEVLWHLHTEEDSEASIEFLPALNEIYKRANPDLQATPQAVIRSIEIFLKSLPETQYLDFLDQLGSWDAGQTVSSMPQGP